jgi:hypothetical protein
MVKLYVGRHEDLRAQDAITLEYDPGGQMITSDNYLQQYEWGYMSEAYWHRTIAELKCTFEHPWYRQTLDG